MGVAGGVFARGGMHGFSGQRSAGDGVKGSLSNKALGRASFPASPRPLTLPSPDG